MCIVNEGIWNMFILMGSIASFIISVIWIFAFVKEKTFGKCFHCILKNFFIINLVSLAIQRYVLKYRHFLVTGKYGADNFILFFFIALAVGFLFMFISALFNGLVAFEKEEPDKRRGAGFVKVISAVFVALGSACYFGTIWGKGAFGDVTADQLLINLTSPTEGTEASVYVDGFEGPVFQTILVTAIFCLLVFRNFRLVYKGIHKNKTIFNSLARRILCLVLSVACLTGGIAYGAVEFRFRQIYYSYFLESDMIDSNYMNPRTAKITFPEKKRNLIHIYLESMENSFLSKELGGYMVENLMPELTELSYEGLTFSNTDTKFGGPLQATGTQWSVASMINMTSGLPMKVPGVENSYGAAGNFLPGAYTLGEILKEQGYEQTVMIGSDANFGGLNYYYQSHGDYKIMDYRFALKNGLLPKGYNVWWGYEDEKLYEFAKNEITRLYETGKPFNFTMETADTHRPGGYHKAGELKLYPQPYANAIALSTADTVKFVRWIQSQPFYENTTVILIGDHISMDTDFFEYYKFDKNYLRTQYNLILNPAPNVANVAAGRLVNRQYANFDMFPTIIAGLGAEIEGDRLGIGTNLFSNKDTLFEEYGVDFVNNELEKKSEIYNNTILVDPSSVPPVTEEQ